jgi:hypothetical protein
MTDKKAFQGKGDDITYWWVPAGGIANILKPTAAEINAGVNLSLAIAADGTEVGASDSSDISDRSIVDRGNAVEPGFDQYAATLTLFHPYDLSKTADPYVVAYNLFKTQQVEGFIVKRRLQASYLDAAVAGQMVSVFKVTSDHTAHDTAGEDSVKLTVAFLPQGSMAVNTFVGMVSAVVASETTLALGVGDKAAVTATLGAGGPSITQGATWSSSDVTKATVSENGVVVGVAAGSATITVSHPSATAADTIAVTVS